MLSHDRYITRGIQAEISLDLQLHMWQMIQELEKQEIKMDYLQVFKLKPKREKEELLQEIEHTQEIPSYQRRTIINVSNIYKGTVFVIESMHEDRSKYWTMMLASEY